MKDDDDVEKFSGGLVCLSLVLIVAVGAIAGGTLILNIATHIQETDRDHGPIEVSVGGPLGQQNEDEDGKSNSGRYDDGIYDEEVWMIATNEYDTANNYIDEETGQVVGFNIDVINEVCHIANKHCQLVLDSFGNAWSGGLGGPALLGGWYDCAQGWFITYPRIRTFLHTEPFTKAEPGVFLVANGNPAGFDWQDLSGRKVAFFTGWFTDPACISRYSDEIEGSRLREENIVLKDTEDGVIEAVQSGEADAAFVSRDLTDITDALQKASPYLDRCTLGGASLMCRKDSHLPSWWNPAWRKLLGSRRHEDFCDRIDTTYSTLFIVKEEPTLRGFFNAPNGIPGCIVKNWEGLE